MDEGDSSADSKRSGGFVVFRAAHGPAAHDGTIIPDRPDATWGTDASSALTAEGPATIFV